MKQYGLIGYPLSHSFSKKYFTEKFERENIEDHEYQLYELESLSDFPELLQANPGLCGLNVTVPHKIGVMYYLDYVHPDAKEIDAVNCIRITAESPIAAVFSGELGMKDKEFRLEGFNIETFIAATPCKSFNIGYRWCFQGGKACIEQTEHLQQTGIARV
jgi:shikimate dehydrogenase